MLDVAEWIATTGFMVSIRQAIELLTICTEVSSVWASSFYILPLPHPRTAILYHRISIALRRLLIIT